MVYCPTLGAGRLGPGSRLLFLDIDSIQLLLESKQANGNGKTRPSGCNLASDVSVGQ